MTENRDLEMQRQNMKKLLTQRYKKSAWDEFKNAVGIFFLAIFLLILIIGIIALFVTLFENPVSLAIICLTIFFIIERFMR